MSGLPGQQAHQALLRGGGGLRAGVGADQHHAHRAVVARVVEGHRVVAAAAALVNLAVGRDQEVVAHVAPAAREGVEAPLGAYAVAPVLLVARERVAVGGVVHHDVVHRVVHRAHAAALAVGAPPAGAADHAWLAERPLIAGRRLLSAVLREARVHGVNLHAAQHGRLFADILAGHGAHLVEAGALAGVDRLAPVGVAPVGRLPQVGVLVRLAPSRPSDAVEAGAHLHVHAVGHGHGRVPAQHEVREGAGGLGDRRQVAGARGADGGAVGARARPQHDRVGPAGIGGGLGVGRADEGEEARGERQRERDEAKQAGVHGGLLRGLVLLSAAYLNDHRS
jgi:hypothetical protein